MGRRPVFTLAQILAHVFSVLILLGVGIYLLLVWVKLPSQIPSHYDFLGQPDAWQGKGSLIFVYLTDVAVYLLLLVVSFFPNLWNMPTKITSENADRLYGYCGSMLSSMAICIVFLLSYITISSSLARPLGIWFLPVLFLGLFGLMGYYVMKMIRCK